MTSPDFARLRFLLAALREKRPSEEAQRRAVATFKRWARQEKRHEDRGRPGENGN